MWTENVAAENPVYLDNNASTRMDPRVLDAMLPFFCEDFGNASSAHSMGMAAAEAVHGARRQVQEILGAAHPEEIVFTSGGSEANNTAILSALETQRDRNEVVVSAVEHPSVLALSAHLERTGRATVIRVPVGGDGSLNLDAYVAALSERTAVVSIQWANNETGVIYPIAILAAMAHDAGALFHCDAVQAAGKIDLSVALSGVDMLSVSAHKMHGPKGVGALYVRKGIRFTPLILGGRQERGRRAGTENTAGIVGFGEAAKIALLSLQQESEVIANLRDRLEENLLAGIPHSIVIGDREHRLPNTLCVAFAGVEGDEILILLDQAGVIASSGSACASGLMETSHVLRAMKVPFDYIRGAIRFSFSQQNTSACVGHVLSVLPGIVQGLRTSDIPEEVLHG